MLNQNTRAKQFLKQCEVGGENSGKSISEYFVDEIISLVGGRVQVIRFKQL